MNTVAIVQARMGSTRLPGKVLRKLQDQTVLGHVIQRLKVVNNIDAIVVATTNLPHDQEIEDEVKFYGVPCFRGSEDDVLSRYYGAALESNADVIIRVTSDCPLIEPSVVESVVSLLTASEGEYASNALIRTFPRGLDVEAFTMQVLAEANLEASKPEQREHVTPYIYQNPQKFKIVDYVSEIDYSHFRWTLDTSEDWELIQEIYKRLYKLGEIFSWREAIKLMAEYPELAAINKHVEQKKLTP